MVLHLKLFTSLCFLLTLTLLLNTVHTVVIVHDGMNFYENSIVRMSNENPQFMGSLNDWGEVVMWNSTGQIIATAESSGVLYSYWMIRSVTPQISMNCFMTARQDSYSRKYFILRTCLLPRPSNIAMLDTVSDEPILDFYYDNSDYSLFVANTKGVLGMWTIAGRKLWFKEIPELADGQAQLIKFEAHSYGLFTSKGFYSFDTYGTFTVNDRVNFLVNYQKFVLSHYLLFTIEQYKEQMYGLKLYRRSQFNESGISTPLIDSQSKPIDMRNCSQLVVGSSIFFVCQTTTPIGYVFGFDNDEKRMELKKEIKIPAKVCSTSIGVSYSELFLACDNGIVTFDLNNNYKVSRSPINVPVTKGTTVFYGEGKKYIFSNSIYGNLPIQYSIEII